MSKRVFLNSVTCQREKEGMAKRKQLSTKHVAPRSKGRFNFDLGKEDFEHFKDTFH